jgi:AcrR family transcriptional regulator
MTNDDVIKAAFRVWGRELYKTTSLAKLADALKVSKSALYRHFPDKQALLAVMEERFYDDYAAVVKPIVRNTRENDGWRDQVLTLVGVISDFFARNPDYFVYCMIGLHDSNSDLLYNISALKKRGVSFENLEPGAGSAPSVLFLTGVTGFFSTAIFYKRRFGITNDSMIREWIEKNQSLPEPTEESIRLFSDETRERVRNGLSLDRAAVENLPYDELEQTNEVKYAPPDPLLKAVAEVVAEAGPWNASMETVARRSGLSKSGLYAHFESKEDMLSRLFMSEFDRIAHYSGALRSKSGKNREAQLYLAILSIADYLRIRPEIITALSWVRIQHLELDISVPVALYDFFADLQVDDSFEDTRGSVSQWILLMLLAVLKHYCAIDTLAAAEKIDYRILRRLFRFICLGINGLE